jgi:eukaryotic-like serine/threonine-protein kinase
VEREKAQQVTSFLLDLFHASGPQQGAGDTVSARALLARGEAHATALDRQPAVQAAMFHVIGQVRSDLGAFVPARASLERALAIRQRLLGDAHPDAARSRLALAQLDARAGDFTTAERGYRAALDRLRTSLGDTAAATQEALFGLASAMHAAGHGRGAQSLLDAWQQAASRSPRRRDAAYANQLQALGDLLRDAGRRDSSSLDQAARVYGEALALRRELYGPRHLDVAASASALAGALWARGRRAEAEPHFREALTIMRAAYPDGHPKLALALANEGGRLLTGRRYADAIPILREATAIAARHLPADDPLTGVYEGTYGNALRQAGEYAAAEPVLRDAEARLSRARAPGGLMAVRVRVYLGDVLRAQGRTREAESLLLPAYTQLAAERGTAHPQTQFALRELVKLYETAGRPAEAARHRALITPASGGALPR